MILSSPGSENRDRLPATLLESRANGPASDETLSETGEIAPPTDAIVPPLDAIEHTTVARPDEIRVTGRATGVIPPPTAANASPAIAMPLH